MSNLNLKLALILGTFIAIVLASTVLVSNAYAQGEDSDETTPVRKTNRRYAGGQDEQLLTVQTSLPLPTRYPDAPRPTPAAAGPSESSND